MTLPRRSWAEPFKIKAVEPLRITTREEREVCIREAGYNTFLLKSKDVYIDLLTDSGTSAMSARQWAALMMGDEAYAGSESFYEMADTIKEYYGYEHVIPTHQGRGAEHLLSQALIKKGDAVPGNMYFTTTRLHQEIAGGIFVDVIVDEAHDPENLFPFKANIDLAKLEKVVKEYGAKKVAYVSFEGNVNMAGGQPASMQNFREVYEYCKERGIPVMARIAEAAGMELRIFPRDDNPDIMSEFLNQGEHQSIPVFVFYTRGHRYIAHWTERPAKANAELPEMMQLFAGKSREEARPLYEEFQHGPVWANWRRETVREIFALLKKKCG